MADSFPPSSPIPALPLEYAGAGVSQPSRALRVLGWLSIVTLVIGTILSCFEVETVIGSGPALAIIGLAMVIYGLRDRRQALWIPGLAHLAIVGVFVLLVNAFHLSPAAASVPFPVMSGIYTIGMTIALLRLMSDERRRVT